MESKYLEKFAKLNGNDLPLRGNRMLVELLPKEEIKSAGGIVLSSSSDHRTSTKENQADLAVVLAVGNGYYDEETGETSELDIKVGSVILVSRMGLKPYSQFPGLPDYTQESIALTRDTEAHCVWPSIAEYIAYRKKLNS